MGVPFDAQQHSPDRTVIFSTKHNRSIGAGLQATSYVLSPLHGDIQNQGFMYSHQQGGKVTISSEGLKATLQLTDLDNGTYRLRREIESNGYFLHFRPSVVPGEYIVSHPVYGEEVKLSGGSFLVAVKTADNTLPKHLGILAGKTSIPVTGVVDPRGDQKAFLASLLHDGPDGAERLVSRGLRPEFAVITLDRRARTSDEAVAGLTASKIMRGNYDIHGPRDNRDPFVMSRDGGTRASINMRVRGDNHMDAMQAKRREFVQADTVINGGMREYVELKNLDSIIVAGLHVSYGMDQDGTNGIWIIAPDEQTQFVPIQNGQPIIFGRYGYNNDSGKWFHVSHKQLSLEDVPGISSTKTDVLLVGTPSRDEIRTIVSFNNGIVAVEQISSAHSSAQTAILIKK